MWKRHSQRPMDGPLSEKASFEISSTFPPKMTSFQKKKVTLFSSWSKPLLTNQLFKGRVRLLTCRMTTQYSKVWHISMYFALHVSFQIVTPEETLYSRFQVVFNIIIFKPKTLTKKFCIKDCRENDQH